VALFAFDGTWNQSKTGDDKAYKNTNVVRFKDIYSAGSGEDEFYVNGIGTGGNIFDKYLGAAFGLGGASRLQKAYDALCISWAAGDRNIDVVGFSRGAASALDFQNLVFKDGIRQPNGGAVVEPSPQIRFLGLWDVVGAFGLAFLGATDLNIGHHLSLPSKNLKYCFHAMALDERRPSFLQTRLRNAHEVWFRGVHSDVGGGNGNRGLNDITLQWMLRKALACDLPIRKSDIDALKPKPATSPKWGAKLPIMLRAISAVDRRHYTVGPMKGCANPPATCIEETAGDETTGQTVGPFPIEILPVEVRRRILYLWEVSVKTAAGLGFSLDPLMDQLLTMYQGRIPLINNDQDLARAGQAAATLIAVTVRAAQAKQYATLKGVFLTEALFNLRPQWPFTD
jgi:hypothetical protein